jgi:hypothetical protein
MVDETETALKAQLDQIVKTRKQIQELMGELDARMTGETTPKTPSKPTGKPAVKPTPRRTPQKRTVVGGRGQVSR